MTEGYSKTPLLKKLGIKPQFKVLFVNAPPQYEDLLGPLPEGTAKGSAKEDDLDFIHLFSTSREDLEARLPGLKKRMRQNGMIWTSWPKKASGVDTDLNGDAIRQAAFRHGLVDIKVCAVDQIWSGLKLVIPVKDRSP